MTDALLDPAVIRMQPIRPDDEPRLISLYEHLSERSIYQRFFTLMPRLPQDWAHKLANVDYVTRSAIVLEQIPADDRTPEQRSPAWRLDPPTRIPAPALLLGVARYEPTKQAGLAEVAFVVRDEFQGQGHGKRLLAALLAEAAANGITRYRADVLAGNRRMLGMLARHTRIVSRSLDSGVAEVLFERA